MPDITGIMLDLSHIYNYVVYQSCKTSFFKLKKISVNKTNGKKIAWKMHEATEKKSMMKQILNHVAQ